MAKKHPLSHLPIPKEVELAEIIELIVAHKDSPQALKTIEDFTPPHIMEALVKFSKQRANEAKMKADEAELELKLLRKSIQENKALTNEILQFKESLKTNLESKKD